MKKLLLILVLSCVGCNDTPIEQPKSEPELQQRLEVSEAVDHSRWSYGKAVVLRDTVTGQEFIWLIDTTSDMNSMILYPLNKVDAEYEIK